ncbi:MAG: cytochrome C oxidase subunit I [Candidatus Parabeggiatoa sp. nov. 3]|nr:MAG: cytochrome C oxidase subunit I [Gammaproteobacteria bacterium]RKZ54656.1 MAG: cytochrome C oxidase subunit I [Gammaproteobacteria bacterium]RKZ75436.1 MAG: cytochrome C oxidase subunit I [Gammaproteobacteria bacterium]HEW97495.1 cytochrome C oxidase subunit I [Beggiatoa sp.]
MKVLKTMQNTDFTLEIPQGTPRYLTIGWLGLALASLVIGGLLTILIVLSRTPFFQEIIPWIDFFHTALVVHVDLTVLVWFLAFAGVFWSLISRTRCLCGWLPLLFAVVGTILMSIAPFMGEGHPVMSNYVPVLQMPLFLGGLGLFGLGFTLLVLHGLMTSHPLNLGENGAGALRFGLFTALLTALIAIMALIWSYSDIASENISGQYYYELLFWGSGHVLQFTHTQLMLVAWLWLASVLGVGRFVSPRVAIMLFALGMAPTLLTPWIYWSYDVTSPSHIVTFTWLMQYGGGLAALPLGLMLVLGLMKGAIFSPERSALIFSILLFAVGGIIGFLITGSNVTVPAHYHGSIVAVTLAFMGITYHLMPRLGFREIKGKWAQWQPAILGTGQLLHVLGLAWSGGYGVPRKTAGAAQGLESIQQQVGMGLMGLGGMIAIIGGIIFLVLVFMAMRPQKNQ